MEIEANVRSISELEGYFFLVPDYQREYAWKADDQVEQFIEDIENEYDAFSKDQKSYFIGSIIIVKNNGKYDVVDGQQRLTTAVIMLCAFRDLLKNLELDNTQQPYLKTIEEWLSDFDLEAEEHQVRLELQYEESKDYLKNLIQNQPYQDEVTDSIKKMTEAHEYIQMYLKDILDNRGGINSLISFAKYFLTKIELVVIESENLSSALKIFETINQRGVGLTAMDLLKTLLFSQAKEKDFQKIKEYWRKINSNLQDCGEEQSPLRFLRYFLMARYHNGVLRDDEIYKWIISIEGKKATQYESNPHVLAAELVKLSRRYADLVKAAANTNGTSQYPAVARIGFMNKFKSRQHLILLLALKENCSNEIIEALAKELESFFFYSNTLGIRASRIAPLFAQWAVLLRPVETKDQLAEIVETTVVSYIRQKTSDFKQKFVTLPHNLYNPLYRQRYILGQLENTLRRLSGMPEQGLPFFNNLQIEHILPQTPKDSVLPKEFEDEDDYNSSMNLLGNVTLLESNINQAINMYNDLSGYWFQDKQIEYAKSNILMTALLNSKYSIGKNTRLNKFKSNRSYLFNEWNKNAIQDRQQILLDLSMDTWLLNGKRIDS